MPDVCASVSAAQRPLVLNGGEEINFVMTCRVGSIAGFARDRSAVVLIPESSGDPNLVRRTESSAGGAFDFQNLAPGKYRIEGGPEVEVRAGETVTVAVAK